MTINRPITFILCTAAISLLFVFPPAAAGQKSATKKKTELQWTKLEPAVAKAADEKKAVMVDVYTDWCGWCKKMDKEVFTDPAVAEVLASRFALAKVNGESKESITFKGHTTNGIGIAQSFGVRGYPSIIFLDSNGDMLTMIPGFLDAEKFLPVVTFIGNREYEKMEWDAYLAKYNASRNAAPATK
jgi:thioredoxin-related protein